MARRDQRIRALIARATRQHDLVIVPAVVLAETTHGGPGDAPVNQVMKEIDEVAVVTESTARTAGRLLRQSGLRSATVDALIVAEAVLRGPSIILTSDLDDLSRLADGHAGVRVFSV